MRKLFGLMAVVLGIVSVTITARYGYKMADTPTDAWIAAIMFGAIALCAFTFDGGAVHLWYSGYRGVALLLAAIALLCLVVTFGNSLGAIVGRNDKVMAERSKVVEDRKSDQKELARLEAMLAEIERPVPTDQAAVEAARIAADTATAQRAAECANGDPRQRGPKCIARETDERNALAKLAFVTAAKAATDRVLKLEADIATVRARLKGGQAVASANPLGSALEMIFGMKAPLVTAWQSAVIALVFELCLVGTMIGYVSMGHASKPTGDERLSPGPEIVALKSEPAPLEALPPPDPQPVVPSRPRPKLAAATRKPIGSVLDFLHDGVDLERDSKTEMAEAFIGYATWCKAHSLRPMAVGPFVDEMEALCKQFGIRIRPEGGHQFLIDVQLKQAETKAGDAGK